MTFFVETPQNQQTKAAPIVHEATDFSAHVVVVKTLFLSEIYKLEREINKQVERKYQ